MRDDGYYVFRFIALYCELLKMAYDLCIENYILNYYTQ